MRLRNISRMIVIALVVVVGAVALIHQRLADAQPDAPATPALVGGTALNFPTPAMSLTDQSGQLVTTASLAGRPTVVTFLDMTCTTECPLQAQLMNQTAQFMGAQQASRVNWIVVTVNPSNTSADAATFLQKNKVNIPIKVLLGTQAQLAPIWNAYGIYVCQPTPGADVQHSIAYFVLDKSLRERMVFVQALDPKALSQDLTALLATQGASNSAQNIKPISSKQAAGGAANGSTCS